MRDFLFSVVSDVRFFLNYFGFTINSVTLYINLFLETDNMYCSNCGSKLPDSAKFCDVCGTPVSYEIPQQNTTEPNSNEKFQSNRPEIYAAGARRVTDNIILGTDGKYHWYYEFKLLRNPTILFLLWKIFFWIFIGIWLFVSFLHFYDGYTNIREYLHMTLVFLLIVAGIEVLVALGYFIYAAFQGFKYCVMFQMDENGVKHIQMPKQFKKAQAASMVAVLAGMVTGNPGTVGTGLLAASHQMMESSWNSVRRVEIFRRRNVIKVNERLNKNQVYASDADFRFVEDYIRSHVQKRCKFRERQ